MLILILCVLHLMNHPNGRKKLENSPPMSLTPLMPVPISNMPPISQQRKDSTPKRINDLNEKQHKSKKLSGILSANFGKIKPAMMERHQEWHDECYLSDIQGIHTQYQ
ncbi:uncharacterized protein LOC120357543 isoform X2 [Solenopsis invicta]|uniref:uncharacterized protein LOC120357543 isoform X2 n=1 Tax=Solenopsis invicta TaxID=13686 RepID=UPI00193E77FB|nr:uncharacterized protein LOC120357543 isoform X2 [Solenopsis invicta]